MKPRTLLPTCASLLIGTTGCLGHSSYQSARITKPDRPQATIAAARTTLSDHGFRDREWWTVEFMGRRAISRHADFGAKLSTFNSDGTHAAVLALDWKVAVLEDLVAASFGVGTLMPVYQAVHFVPGVIVTVPVTPHLDVNASGKAYAFAASENFAALHAYSLGLGIRVGDSGFALRPEWAVLVGNSDEWVQFGVGIDLPTSKPEKPHDPWGGSKSR